MTHEITKPPEMLEAARARAEIAGMPGSESRFALFETFDDYLKDKDKGK